MTSTLLNLSSKIDKLFLAIFEDLETAARQLNIPYFIVGATARDIILNLGYNIPIGRATVDIDLGINVSSWEQFDQLKETLTNTGRFSSRRAAQRLQYEDAIPVDIVPFGAIASPDGNIHWPPDQDPVMNTLGFDDAFALAQPVRLRDKPPLDVKFASPLGLAVMKLVAWADRHAAGTKDATDLALVLSTYLDAGNRERLFHEHLDLISDDFDYVLTGAELLGRDIVHAASPAARTRITEIVRAETKDESHSRLAEDMTSGSSATPFDQHFRMLLSLRKGLSR